MDDKIIPEDMKAIAAKFEAPAHVRYLLPVRRKLKMSAVAVAKQTGVWREFIYCYERMIKLTPKEHFRILSEFYISELLKKREITNAEARIARKDKNCMLETAARFLRLKMSEQELIKWKRDLLQLTNKKIAQLIGCSYAVVVRAINTGMRESVTARITRMLNKMEAQAKGEMTFERYC